MTNTEMGKLVAVTLTTAECRALGRLTDVTPEALQVLGMKETGVANGKAASVAAGAGDPVSARAARTLRMMLGISDAWTWALAPT